MQERDKGTVGTVAVFAGIGLLWGWIYCCWFSPALSALGAGSVFSSSAYIVSIICNVATLLIVPVAVRNDEALQANGSLGLGLALALIGAAGMMAPPGLPFGAGLAWTVGAGCVGVGSGLLWIAWATVYGSVRIEISEVSMPAGSLWVAGAFALANLCPQAVSRCLVLVLPIATVWCLVLARRQVGLTRCEDWGRERGQASGSLRPFWFHFVRICVVVLVIHASIGACWSLLGEGFPARTAEKSVLIMAAAVAVALIANLSMVYFAKRPDIFAMYRWLLPLVVVSLTLVTFTNDIVHTCGVALILAAQLGYTLALWIFFSRISYVFRGSAAVYLGVTHGVAQLGLFCGHYLAMGIGAIEASGLCTQSQVFSIIACCCVTAVLLFMSRESPLGTATAEGPSEERAGGDELQPVCEHVSSEERAVALLVDANGLTERESEVLALLVQGRSVPFVQETLFISKNTANTHVRHIYQKIGVRTKQELIAEYRKVLSDVASPSASS